MSFPATEISPWTGSGYSGEVRVLAKELDFSLLEEIPSEVEEALSPAWKRILAALRMLKEARRD